MARSPKKKVPDPSKPLRMGPYLAAAVIAEKLLTENDKVVTVVRIIDTISIAEDAINVVENSENKNLILDIKIFMSFKAGGFKGNSTLSVTYESPSGQTGPVGGSEIPFNGEPMTGYNIQCPVLLAWEGEGLYWFDISIDNKFINKIPLLVNVAKRVQPI